ncbi:MAG: cobalamin biosynthesis protein CobD [Eubacteriaceae bacterium]|jgi:adenosylcobinamide-phosphate synthase|nr:cobalamin biosynthesis protein CobD [Eubacteriaceae bacterium]
MVFHVSPELWLSMVVMAVVVDWIVGDPPHLPHPIVAIGKLIGFLTRVLNKGNNRQFKGLVMWLVVIFISGLTMLAIQWLAYVVHRWVFIAISVYLLATTLASTCLKQEVLKVSNALKENNLNKARKLLSYLVGRDTEQLNQEEIVKATVETTAENTVDGVLAPLFYMFVGVFFSHFNEFLNPLVMAMVYKAVNTMDSMVGYIHEPYTEFGYFPAILDDVFNYPIARIGSIFMLIGGFLLGHDIQYAWKIFTRDSKNHRSPNAGFPEAAVAGLLQIRLGGSSTYFGHISHKPTIGDEKNPLVYQNIESAAEMISSAETVMLVLVVAAFAIISYVLA